MDYGAEGIRNRIKEHLENPINRIEGGFSMDNIQAVSQELARIINMEVLPIPDRVLLDTAEGFMLDRRGIDFNEIRNPAKKAIGTVTFQGTVGAVIPEGTIILSNDLEFYTTSITSIDGSGTKTVSAECDTEGQEGNVAAGEITALKLSINGIQTVVNEEAFSGGVDEESDESFRARVLEKIRRPITSGNKNHYEYWAKQVSGVGKVKVSSCWNGNGTVKVIVLSDMLDVPDDTIIENVRLHIEENRPIGADVTITKAVPLPVTITLRLVLESGYNPGAVKEQITTDLKKYMNSIAFRENGQLSYYKVGDIVFGVQGVLDITNYTLNGKVGSLEAKFEEFFKLQEVLVDAH